MTETRAVINVDINTAGAAAELRRLQSQLNAFQSTLSSSNRVQSQAAKNLSLQLREAVNATQMFSAETVRMRTSAGRLDDALSKGKGSISQYFNSFRKGSTEAAQVMSLAHARASALQTQFVATGAAAGGYREALAIRPLSAFNATATVSAEKLGIQRAMLTQASTQMINFGKNTQWAGRQLMVGFTVPLTIFGTIAGKTYMELEKQAISFKKVYGDSFTTPQELQENLDAVKVLSEEYTKFGIAASKTMELAAQAAAMGAQGATLTDAITESTKLATLGQMEQTEALETTIALQNAFGLSGEKLAKSVNFLNMVENQTVLTLQDLAEAIPRVSPVIKGLGGTVEDMAAMLAAMKEGGVSAAQGANALKSGLASLINPTDKAVERLKEMGINLETIIRVNRGDLLGTVQAFGKALSTLDEFGRQQALEKVFGKYQYARLGALFNNIVKDGTQASRVLDMASMSAKELNDVAEKELKVISDSPATRMTAAIEKLKLSIAPLGEMFIKFAIPVVELFTRILKIFDGLPDGVKKIGAIGAIIVGVVIPAGTMFLGLLLNLMGTLVKFGHIVGVTFKGLLTGGLSGAIKAVSQSLKYMSLAEIDAAGASMQLGESTLFVNAALKGQISASDGANVAIVRLAESYAVLRAQMQMTAGASPTMFGIGNSAAVAASRAPSRAVPRRLRRNSGGSIPYLSNGNTVPGSGNTDTVPAMLTPGEFVINKKATEKNLPLLYAINDGNTPPGFNKGGQIPGVQYAGIGNIISKIFGSKPKPPKPLSAYDTPPTEEETARILANWPQRPVRPMAYQSQAVATAGKSKGIYGDLTEKYLPGTNSKVDTLRFMVDKLGFSPAALGLQSHGNFVLGFSKSTNLAMAGKNPTLTRERLLAELVDSNGQVRRGVYSPLEQQMSSYFRNGQAFDHDLFDNIFRGQVALSKEPISNKRFEKISRNALREYLRARDYSGPDSRSFIKDILSKDTVRGNASKTAILSSLTARGIPYETNGKDVIATIDGVRYNFGSVAGREMGSLGRPEGIRPYGDLEMSPWAERVHANMGGMIPAMQYFATRIKQRVVQRTAGAHASKAVPIGPETKIKPNDVLPNAEAALYKAQEGAVSVYDGAMFGIDDAYNQAMKSGGPGITNILQFVKHIKAQTPEKFFKYVNIPTQQRKEFKKIFAKNVSQAEPPITDSKFTEIYEKTASDMKTKMNARKEDQTDFNAAIEEARKLRSVRLSFSLPEREEPYRSYPTVAKARDSLTDEEKESIMAGEPFYYHGSSRKASALVRNPVTGNIVGVQTDTDRRISQENIKKINGVPGLHKGALFLGMPHSFKSLTRSNEIKETLARTNISAQSGRSLDFPLMQTGSMVSGLGGRSSNIPGINGIYDMSDGRHVIKVHDTLESALAEARSSSLMRNVFGLESPQQEVIRVPHPDTGDLVFAVRSKYDEAFAQTTGSFEKESFSKQLIASLIRRDSDLSADNVYGNKVADVGAAIFGMDGSGKPRASMPRIIGEDPISVLEQLDINMLMKSGGGAKKHFAESTADIARSMTESEYVSSMKATISRARLNAEEAGSYLPGMSQLEKARYLKTLNNDFDNLDTVDWAEVYKHHIGIYPATKRPPTPASLKKKEEERVLRARQAGHNSPMINGMSFVNGGGMIPGMQYFATRIPRRVVLPAKEYPGFGTLSPEGAVPRPRLSVPPSLLPRAVGSMTYKDWIGKKVSTPLGEGIVIYAKPNLTGAFSLKIKRKHGTGTMSSNDVSIIDDEQLGINGYAHGGQIFESGPSKKIVPGVGNTDTVPAMLTPGEFVINKKATSQNMALLHSINNGSTQAYAKGGIARYAGGGLIEIGKDTKGLTLYKNETGEIVYGNDKRPAPGRIPAGLQTPDPSGPRPRRFAGMGMQASMGMGTLGGAMIMAPMIPGIGENAALSGALSMGGTALSAASILPMLGGMLPATAVTALAGIAPVAIPLVAVLAAVTAALVIWRRSVDDSARASAELGANIGIASNSFNNMAAIIGTQTPAQLRQTGMMGISSEKSAEISNKFSSVFESEEGSQFIKDLESATSVEKFKKLSDYLKAGIASGMMDKDSASEFAKAVGLKTGDSILANQAISSIANQKTGTAAVKKLADARKTAVESEGTASEVLTASTTQYMKNSKNISVEQSGRAIGAAVQILQDYSNLIAVAEEEYKDGTIAWKEYHAAITEARTAQEDYTQVIVSSVQKSSDSSGSRSALTAQMIGTGLSPEQVDAIQHSTDIGISNLNLGIAGSNLDTAYKKDFGFRQAEKEFGMTYSELNSEQKNKIKIDAQEAQALAMDVGTNMNIAELVDAAVIAGDISAESAVKFGQEVMVNVEALQALKDGASIAAANLIMFAENIPGLSPEQSDDYQKYALGFEERGGNLSLLENYTASVPENKRAEAATRLNDASVTGYVKGVPIIAQDRRKEEDLMFGYESLSSSIGKESAFRLQGTDAYKAALNEEGGSRKIDQAFAIAKEAGVSQSVLNYAINTKSNGEDATPEALVGKINELRTSIEAINQLPEEMLIGLDIDITDPKDLEKYGPMVKQLQGYTKILENLNPNIDMIASMKFLTMGNDGELLDPEQVAKNTIILNKAWNNLSSKNKNTRLQAVRQLLISTQDENGNQLDPDQVDASYNDLVNKFGGKIMNLEPDIINKLVSLQIEIEGIDESIAALKAAQVLTSPDQAERIQTQIDVLQAAKKTKLAAQRVAISTPSTGGGGGGGGGEKSIPQQLKKEFNDLKKVHNSMQQFINSKKGQFKGIMAGPFGPEFIEYLKSQGEQGLKVLNGGINKIKAAYEAFKKVRLQNMSNFAQSFPATMIKQTQDIAIKNAFTKRLDKNGFDAETSDQFIEGMGGVDAIRAYNQIKKKDKGKRTEDEQKAFKEMNKAIAQGGPAVKKYLSATTFDGASKSLEDMNKELDNTNKLLQMGYTKEEADQIANLGDVSNLSSNQIKKLGDSVKAYNLAVLASDPEALAQMKRDNAAEIRDIQREIEEINTIRPLEDQVEIQQKIIDGQEKIVRGKQQEIDVIGRAIELKQRELEPLDDQIEKLQELSDKTSEAYDNQIEALDQIYKREDNIAKLKQGQLGVAQALSRGDVAGAAQGALGMSQEIAQQSREEARSALEAQKEAATKNIQDQILAIEKQKKAINQDIKNLQMQQRVIQDDIYRIQSTLILPAENEIYNLQGQINIAAEGLAAKYNNAATAMANLVNQLRLANAEKAILDGTPQPSPNTDSQVVETTTPPTYVPSPDGQPYYPNASIGSDVNLSKDGSRVIGGGAAPAAKSVAKVIASVAANVKASLAKAPVKPPPKPPVNAKAEAIKTSVINMKNKSKTFGGLMSYNNGGMMKKYAYGSMVPGMGMTDKVPALLTPGEFVIRKSVVESYGPMLSNLNSQVFPKMNMTSAMPSTEGNENEGTVYNYQVSVALNGSNLDPNDVANAVMQKIKMSESRNIRSNNIRG